MGERVRLGSMSTVVDIALPPSIEQSQTVHQPPGSWKASVVHSNKSRGLPTDQDGTGEVDPPEQLNPRIGVRIETCFSPWLMWRFLNFAGVV